MGYSMVNSMGTDFAVDWGVVQRFCMSYWRTYYQLVISDTVDMSESSWYNPLSWSLPTIKTVDVPWDKVRDAAQLATSKDMSTYARSASTDMRGVALDVKWKLEQTTVNRKKFTANLKDVQSANMAEIEKSVTDYTGLIEASRFVRDTSADVVAIGSTIATGGAAAGLLGASSALKGWGKYQDTGSAGAAVLYGTGSMVLGAFKVGGAKLTTAGEYTLIIVQGSLESGTSLVAGDTFAKAIERGGLKIASAGGAQALFGSSWVKSVFSRIPVPFNVFTITSREGANIMMTDVAEDVLSKAAKKGTGYALKAGAKALMKPSAPEAAPRGSSVGLADEVPIEQMLLLDFAIVNMKKGIGWGW